MIGLICFALAVVASPFKSKLRLEAENAVLRHQLIVFRRRAAWSRPAHEPFMRTQWLRTLVLPCPTSFLLPPCEHRRRRAKSSTDFTEDEIA